MKLPLIDKKSIQGFVCIILLLAAGCKKDIDANQPEPYSIQHVATGHQGMVVSAHPLASKIGVDILKAGGNAVDAAVAVQFALAVTYPRAGNIGGGGFMVIRDNSGNSYALDYREMAPGQASRDMYLDSLGNVIPGLSTSGHLAAGVPGTVHGLFAAWDSLGIAAEFAELIQPAISLASNGFKVNSAEAVRLNRFQPDFRKYHSESSPFLKNHWTTGDALVQNDLAETLRRIADKNDPSGFYSGETARMIIAEMQRGNGIISYDDLNNYEAKWREPIIGYFNNYKIIGMPPPSSGGIALMQLLEIIEQFNVDKMDRQSVDYIHLLTEAERRVYADRAEFLGDSDFYTVPTNKLLDSLYLKSRMSDFSFQRATLSSAVGAGEFDIDLESFETTHTSVIDKDGMAVSVTTTLNLNYGSKVLVTGGGFFLNDEMDDFSAKPGIPNAFGLIGKEANAIEPKKRMLSSMTPTIVEHNDRVKLVLGTPGGSTIITSVFQVILNTLVHDMELKDAVFAPRFHHQWLPDKIFTEPDLWTKAIRDSLEQRGHQFDERERIGIVKAIIVEDDGRITGVGDHRSDDHASGY